MRNLLLVPLMALATPALAQPAPSSAYPPAPVGAGLIPPALNDPAMPQQIGRTAGSLTRALLNLPVGEIQAAIEGRPVTPADRRRTIGSETGGAPGMDRMVEGRVAATGEAAQRSARALAQALPALEQALGQAAAEIDRATANLPDPNYPRR